MIELNELDIMCDIIGLFFVHVCLWVKHLFVNIVSDLLNVREDQLSCLNVKVNKINVGHV